MKHPLIFWKTVLICLMLAGKTGTYADNYQPSYSTAGFYSLSNTGRTIYSMGCRILARRHRIPAYRSKRMHQLSRRSLVSQALYSGTKLEGKTTVPPFRSHYGKVENMGERKITKRTLRRFSACYRRCYSVSELWRG